MGKVIYSMNVSLDGFVETPNREIDWAIVDEELHRFFNDQARSVDTFLYGRRMYELMAGYWPTADANPSNPGYVVEFAQIWKEKPKIVFSKTLENVDWNSRLVRDNIVDEVHDLTERQGHDVDVGGPTIAAAFMQLGLIDEFQMVVQPVILGGGTPFFPPLDNPLRLTLVETKTFGSGVVLLRYQRAS
jgi:dihydrofolate reductase